MKVPRRAAAWSLLLLPVSLALLPAQAQESIQTVRYTCEGDKSFQAEYFADSVRLSNDNQSLTLPQIPSASGIRYSNGTITLYSKGNEAYVEENGETIYIGCVAQQATSQQTPSPQPAPSPAPVRAFW